MFVAILGRQPELSIAELSAVFGADNVKQTSQGTALVDAPTFDIDKLGGTSKYGEIVAELPSRPKDPANIQAASKYILDHYYKKWRLNEHKTTLGISSYNLRVATSDVQKIGLQLKRFLKKDGVSLRLVPSTSPALSTAQTLHNRLFSSERKVELLLIKTIDRRILIAECRGVQNINAYTKRDHGRPKRDAFVGMLPPKLAQMMLNLALTTVQSSTRVTKPSQQSAHTYTVLDPFCGTGVVLQEAALMGHSLYGTDLSEKMIRYSKGNLDWLQDTHNAQFTHTLEEGDAMTHKWKQPISAVVCETYLGQPFSAPPSPAKLKEVTGNCNHIISSFLKNIHSQLQPGTPLCIAVPAWRDKTGRFTHLPLVSNLQKLGFTRQSPTATDLLYYREDQVVAREILVLKTTLLAK